MVLLEHLLIEENRLCPQSIGTVFVRDIVIIREGSRCVLLWLWWGSFPFCTYFSGEWFCPTLHFSGIWSGWAVDEPLREDQCDFPLFYLAPTNTHTKN